MNRPLSAIAVLIIVNVLLYIITYWVPEMKDTMIELFALYFPQNEKFQIWQFVTNMFMHGGFTHLLFNMYGLWAFGSPLEIMWGQKRFLLFYFLCGIGANVIYTSVNYFNFQTIYGELLSKGLSAENIQNIVQTGSYNSNQVGEYSEERLSQFYQIFNIPSVGASGAIYGVLVAFAVLFPNAKLALIFLPVPIAAKYFIPILISIDLFSGITGFSIFGGGIAHFAHVGGALIGYLLMLYWKKRGVNLVKGLSED